MKFYHVNNVSQHHSKRFSCRLHVSRQIPLTCELLMSGIETVKIIVDAEKEASEMLTKAQARAIEIRKELDSRIKGEREHTLSAAKKEATVIVQRAEEEGKLEAASLEKKTGEKIRQVVASASAKKTPTIDKLVSIILEGKA